MNLENKDADGILQYADPVIAAILNKAISGKDITSREALILFDEKVGNRLPSISDSTITLFLDWPTIVCSPDFPEILIISVKSILKF
mgnify:CR=1 FL=1